MNPTLPTPSPEAKALSDALTSQIMNEIVVNGPISFARYMSLALYTPQLGYYQNPLKKIGREGDFTTAPEISPLFSYCLANQCAELLAQLKDGCIIEFGAGSGKMAADILVALKAKNQLPITYYIVELSATLKARQAETISHIAPDCVDRVVWLSQLPEQPIEAVILANEVLDAMPVTLFTMQDGIKECGITIENNALAYCVLEAENSMLKDTIEKYAISFSENYYSEVNLYLPGWISSLSAVLSRGAVLLIDYGFPRHEYYHPDRTMGTLMCHYQQLAHSNPLIYPGLQDITAHVDFTAVAEAAVNHDFSVVGFTNQAAFLIHCDLLSCMNNAMDEKGRIFQNQQVMRLTSPSEMGELFKVMGLSKNMTTDWMGFKTMNQLMRL
jgi:SAM-dependent MidA family methyltransferase